MENKWLSIQSFQRNQSLLDHINRLVIFLKLKDKPIDSRITTDEVIEAKRIIAKFLEKIGALVVHVEQEFAAPLTGADLKLRSFAKSFVDARGRRSKFKSNLFIDIDSIRRKLIAEDTTDNQPLIDSLNDLKMLLDEQVSLDTKEIINEI